MKIHIIGGSGSGKSYLANMLSKKYNTKHYDLDDLFWDNSSAHYGTKMPIEKRASLLQNILLENNWIIEGIYYEWVSQCFEEADIIYVLNTPKHVYQYRIIKRFIRRKCGLEKGKRETLKSLITLLKWTNKYQNINMKEILIILKKYQTKVIFLNHKEKYII